MQFEFVQAENGNTGRSLQQDHVATMQMLKRDQASRIIVKRPFVNQRGELRPIAIILMAVPFSESNQELRNAWLATSLDRKWTVEKDGIKQPGRQHFNDAQQIVGCDPFGVKSPVRNGNPAVLHHLFNVEHGHFNSVIASGRIGTMYVPATMEKWLQIKNHLDAAMAKFVQDYATVRTQYPAVEDAKPHLDHLVAAYKKFEDSLVASGMLVASNVLYCDDNKMVPALTIYNGMPSLGNSFSSQYYFENAIAPMTYAPVVNSFAGHGHFLDTPADPTGVFKFNDPDVGQGEAKRKRFLREATIFNGAGVNANVTVSLTDIVYANQATDQNSRVLTLLRNVKNNSDFNLFGRLISQRGNQETGTLAVRFELSLDNYYGIHDQSIRSQVGSSVISAYDDISAEGMNFVQADAPFIPTANFVGIDTPAVAASAQIDANPVIQQAEQGQVENF